jgi:hypothetical protein
MNRDVIQEQQQSKEPIEMNKGNSEIRPENIPEGFRFLLSVETLTLSIRGDELLQITVREASSVFSCSLSAK